MKCPPCKGTGIHPGYNTKICDVCQGAGVLSDEKIKNPECPPCKGTGIHPGYNTKICDVCGGCGRLPILPQQELPTEGISTFFVESGKPRSAHLNISDLLSQLKGIIRVCDPYYGTASLYRLDLMTNCPEVRFLSSIPDSREKNFISRAISEFKKEHSNVLFRRTNSKEMHDRYILAETEIILLGHGLKDIGNKDSFIIKLPKSMAADMMKQVEIVFDSKWDNSIEI